MERLIMYGVFFVFLIITALIYRKEMRVQWHSIGTFIGFIVFVSFLRIAALQIIEMYSLMDIPELPAIIKPWKLAFVWWEDLFFVVFTIFLPHKYFKRKWVINGLVLFSSLLFAAGHLYQGLFAFGITLLYPYLISYRYGLKVGFGTVMVCHIIYDFFTYYTIKLYPMLSQ